MQHKNNLVDLAPGSPAVQQVIENIEHSVDTSDQKRNVAMQDLPPMLMDHDLRRFVRESEKRVLSDFIDLQRRLDEARSAPSPELVWMVQLEQKNGVWRDLGPLASTFAVSCIVVRSLLSIGYPFCLRVCRTDGKVIIPAGKC